MGKRAWKIDLCAKHEEQYQQTIEQMAQHAQVIKLPGGFPSPGAHPARRIQKRTTAEREVDKVTRQLARDAGAAVSDRGRLPARIVAKYGERAKIEVADRRRRRRQAQAR
jgi:hypothetical protein